MKLLTRIINPSSEERSPESEKILALAQEHFANAFPNPERQGCPATDLIQCAVNSDSLPEDDLLTHLFACSECFNEYRFALRAWQAEKERDAYSPGWGRLAFERVWGWRIPLSASLVALFLFSTGLVFWRASAPQPNQARSQPTPTAPTEVVNIQSEPVGTTLPIPAITKQPATSKNRLLAINLDLNEHRSLGVQQRGAEKSEPPISLPRANVQLQLRLPSDSVPGRYRVSLLDDYLKPIVSGQAITTDGNHLVVKLDLRRLPRQFFRLSLTHGDDAPYFYRVVVADQ